MLLKGEAISAIVPKHWGDLKGATTEDMKKEIDRVLVTIGTGGGEPASGKKLFTSKCAVCHNLHNEGLITFGTQNFISKGKS